MPAGVGNSISIEVELRNAASCFALKSWTLVRRNRGAAQSGEGVVPTISDWDALSRVSAKDRTI